MASTPTRLMTVAELDQLPEAEAFYYELRHGEPVRVTRPKHGHFILQQWLAEFLKNSADGAGAAYPEVAFRALPEHELRVADVAYASKERWAAVPRDDYFRGVPDIVIEVLSPSNTASEILDKEKLCLENGCREFWVVDIDRRQVKVSTPDGLTVTYRSGQEIPLLFSTAKLPVDAIFA